MENKEIYIDGVDVSGCDYYCDGKCLCEYNEINRKIIRYYSCNKFPNCYYKQLKRKEQECEKLKEQLIQCDDNIIVDCEYSKKDLCSFIHRKKEVINGLEQQLDQLKAENEELKDIFNEGCLHNLTLMTEQRVLLQTLTEIKEIIHFNKTNRLSGGADISIEQILQKISEVENGHNG